MMIFVPWDSRYPMKDDTSVFSLIQITADPIDGFRIEAKCLGGRF